MYFQEFIDKVREEEGCVLTAYWDEKRWSIGYGTISHEGEVITKEEANFRMLKYAEYVWDALLPRMFPLDINEFTHDRRIALALMIYQMGYNGVQNFKNMVKAIRKGQWTEAGYHALDSNWSGQTNKRARRVAKAIFSGRF